MKLVALSAALAAVAAGMSECNPADEYEYVIIGSGAGGGTLAANLARAGHSVFLIEAGEEHGQENIQRVPGLNNQAAEADGSSWRFWVEHFQNQTQARRDDKYTYILSNGSYYAGLDPPADAKPQGIYYPRGSTLGGSSQVNAMGFALPPDNEWRRIVNLTGDQSWAPENMRKYFIEVENNQYLPPGVEGHGYDGYIATEINNITHITSRDGVSRVYKNSVKMLEGIKVESEDQLNELLSRDLNRLDTNRYTHQASYNFHTHTSKSRLRSGAYQYIASVRDAVNEDNSPTYPLTISTNTLATRVLFHNNKGRGVRPRAYGVEYMIGDALYEGDRRYDPSQAGELRRVRASKEVIVAGGSFNTPQILKLSGVGPRKELESFGIPVVMDLPAVGSHMQDNYEGGMTVRANTPWDGNPFADCTFDPNATPEEDPCLAELLGSQSGPYGDGGSNMYMWFKSSQSESDDCDIFMFGAAAEFRGFWPGYSTAIAPNTSFFFSAVKMQVGDALGTVELNSADPRRLPKITFNWFEENGDRDLQALAEAVEYGLRLMNATGTPFTPMEQVEPQPGKDIKQELKDRTFSHHVSSTCRLGPKGDPNYCVDSEFKVNGVDNLRVVDASVFPRAMGAFPISSVFTISRKAFCLLTAGEEGTGCHE